MKILGQFQRSSNQTFLVQIEGTRAVYKPVRGERELWDFQRCSLAPREVAAYLVSKALKYNFVPLTVWRRDALMGPGSLQVYIDADPDQGFLSLRESETSRLKPVALFDAVINNTDRKAGHILVDHANNLWLIDHGVSFHREDKLRTVVWDFAGQPIDADLMSKLTSFRWDLAPQSPLYKLLRRLLSASEIRAMQVRIERLLQEQTFPLPSRLVPPLPWPLY